MVDPVPGDIRSWVVRPPGTVTWTPSCFLNHWKCCFFNHYNHNHTEVAIGIDTGEDATNLSRWAWYESWMVVLTTISTFSWTARVTAELLWDMASSGSVAVTLLTLLLVMVSGTSVYTSQAADLGFVVVSTLYFKEFGVISTQGNAYVDCFVRTKGPLFHWMFKLCTWRRENWDYLLWSLVWADTGVAKRSPHGDKKCANIAYKIKCRVWVSHLLPSTLDPLPPLWILSIC